MKRSPISFLIKEKENRLYRKKKTKNLNTSSIDNNSMISIERVKLWESTLTIHRRVKTVHILDPGIPLPGINPEKYTPKKKCKRMYAAAFYYRKCEDN